MKKGYAGGGMMKKMMKKGGALMTKMKKGGSVLKMNVGGNVGDLRSASKEGNKGMSAMIASGDKGKEAAKKMGFTAKKGGAVMTKMKKGGSVMKMMGGGMAKKGYKNGGKVVAKGKAAGGASKRADGVASKGKTKGRIV